MPEYRVYVIGIDDRIVNAVPFECADDAEAIEKAEQLIDGHDIELWKGDRLIAKFAKKRRQT